MVMKKAGVRRSARRRAGAEEYAVIAIRGIPTLSRKSATMAVAP